MRRFCLIRLAVFACVLLAPMQHARTRPLAADYVLAFPDFSARLSPAAPGDVDQELEATLERQGALPKVQRLFELYGWQLFVAVNWPMEADSRPAASPRSAAPPRWAGWTRLDDLIPPTPDRRSACRRFAMTKAAPPSSANPQPLRRHLWLTSSLRHVGLAELRRISDPRMAPLIDQNGNPVFYETVLDPSTARYVCGNGLFSRAGQAAFAAHGKTVRIPRGEVEQDWSGSFILKLAWKVLDPAKGDRPERFITARAQITDLLPDGTPIRRDVVVGLVGLHIVHHTASAPQGIWATFEQIDNLATDPVAEAGVRPSFHNPDCVTCVPNQPPPRAADGAYERRPAQVTRAIPIARATAQLNAEVQAVFAKLGSVWRYYRLIGVQWPTVPAAKPATAADGLVQRIVNASGGDPSPPTLANAILETYVQAQVQPACRVVGLAVGSTCRNATPVYAAPSCMSCHGSAAMAVHAAAGTPGQTNRRVGADFAWFLADVRR